MIQLYSKLRRKILCFFSGLQKISLCFRRMIPKIWRKFKTLLTISVPPNSFLIFFLISKPIHLMMKSLIQFLNLESNYSREATSESKIPSSNFSIIFLKANTFSNNSTRISPTISIRCRSTNSIVIGKRKKKRILTK